MKKMRIISMVLALFMMLSGVCGISVSADSEHDSTAVADNDDYDMDLFLTYGDANDDGNVTAIDVLLIRKYLAGQSVKIKVAVCDVTVDNKITAADVLLIRKYIAGQNVTLGPERPAEVISGENKSYEQTQEFVQKMKCGWNLTAVPVTKDLQEWPWQRF